MRVPKFRIRTLMIAVAVVAVGLAALANPLSKIWASVMFTLTVLILLTATLGALAHRDRSCIGFACFGWAFLFIAFGPWRRSDATSMPTPLTTMLLKDVSLRFSLDKGMPGHIAVDVADNVQGISQAHGGGPCVPYTFLQTGNSLFSLFMGCVGCMLARYPWLPVPSDPPEPK